MEGDRDGPRTPSSKKQGVAGAGFPMDLAFQWITFGFPKDCFCLPMDFIGFPRGSICFPTDFIGFPQDFICFPMDFIGFRAISLVSL